MTLRLYPTSGPCSFGSPIRPALAQRRAEADSRLVTARSMVAQSNATVMSYRYQDMEKTFSCEKGSDFHARAAGAAMRGGMTGHAGPHRAPGTDLETGIRRHARVMRGHARGTAKKPATQGRYVGNRARTLNHRPGAPGGHRRLKGFPFRRRRAIPAPVPGALLGQPPPGSSLSGKQARSRARSRLTSLKHPPGLFIPHREANTIPSPFRARPSRVGGEGTGTGAAA